MDNIALIARTTDFVKEKLTGAEAGHDWWHVLRVWNNAKLIAQSEDVDQTVVELAALLHDIADAKFHDGDEEIGPKTAVAYLKGQKADDELIEKVAQIIRHISFKSNIDGQKYFSDELAVVQDADRLDAIGAMGIARAFTYGGYKGRELYNPDIQPNLNMTKEEYKNSNGPTINHFYEKLLQLKDKMNTATGKQLAGQRHEFMQQYLDQFYAEWEGRR